MKLCVKCIVKGKVQGVWYRQSTLRMADAFGVTGWVKNLSDGSVELLACGEQEDVDKLKAWLWQGPMHSEVVDVLCDEVEFEELVGFRVVEV